MLLVVHAATGAIIGQHSTTAFMAFVLSFIAHFIMDFIPHGDHELMKQYQENKQTASIYFHILSDWLSTLFFVIAFMAAAPEGQLGNLMMWGIFGGVLPDLFCGLYYVSKGHLMHNFTYLHHKIHNYLPERKHTDVSFKSAVLVQLFLLFFVMKGLF